jgi:hypothetical protein
MSSWTYRTQGSEMSRFSATRTLNDFPLLIGEILRRGDIRSQRRAKRRLVIREIKAAFGVRN